jgi:Lrp/AsnC family transcriptional regulator, leucine-responsive regulatory protein
MNAKVDQYDFRILEFLQQDARISHAEIGRRVHLSQPAVSERIRRLEASGVIAGYRAYVDPAKLGYAISAMIRVRANRHGDYDRFVRERPEIVECRTVTGDDCAVMRVLATDVAHLQSIIESLNRFGATSTAIVLSTDVDHKPVRAPLTGVSPGTHALQGGAAESGAQGPSAGRRAPHEPVPAPQIMTK